MVGDPLGRWDEHEIEVTVQWSVKLREFDVPKYGKYTVALTARAREVLLTMKRTADESPFVFTTLRGTHYTSSSRTHHWNRVRAAAGLGDTTLYMATRHHFGWYALNILDLESAVIAEQFGHKDGGKLVEQLYGHPDRARRRQRLREAHDGASQRSRTLQLVRDSGASGQ